MPTCDWGSRYRIGCNEGLKGGWLTEVAYKKLPQKMALKPFMSFDHEKLVRKGESCSSQLQKNIVELMSGV